MGFMDKILDFLRLNDDDDEYENVADAFDEYLDNVEFDEVVKDDEE